MPFQKYVARFSANEFRDQWRHWIVQYLRVLLEAHNKGFEEDGTGSDNTLRAYKLHRDKALRPFFVHSQNVKRVSQIVILFAVRIVAYYT